MKRQMIEDFNQLNLSVGISQIIEQFNCVYCKRSKRDEDEKKMSEQ
jgi:hypothetical protein